MMFEVGDAVVHPAHGAGVVAGIREFGPPGSEKRYYQIRMARKTSTDLMIPVRDIEDLGIRPALSVSKLEKLWLILDTVPEDLPSDHKVRYRAVEKKLDSGSIWQLAEAVRDMAWRGRQDEGFTTKGRRIYQKALRKLASELAVSLDIELKKAEERLSARLDEAFDTI